MSVNYDGHAGLRVDEVGCSQISNFALSKAFDPGVDVLAGSQGVVGKVNQFEVLGQNFAHAVAHRFAFVEEDPVGHFEIVVDEFGEAHQLARELDQLVCLNGSDLHEPEEQ